MDPTYSDEAEAFRTRIQEFLSANLPSGWQGIGALDRDEILTFQNEWRQKLAANGLLAPAWPSAYGGGGLSELRAELDGDEWTINGQKIWTSAGQWANWIFVLCRTDPDAPKHRGISFLLCPMDQDGVEVRPIEMLSGDADFNETFFTDARTPKDNVIGEVNAGWGVAMTLLGYERGEAAATMPIMFRAEFDKLVELARLQGVSNDPVIRDRIASLYCEVEIMRLQGMQALTKFLGGEHPGPGESTFKLYWSEYHQKITELALDILGAAAMTPDGIAKTSFHTDLPGAPNNAASWTGAFYNARAGTIYAGTSEVQRNIIGELVLGLPKEPKAAQ